ncbi:hypothetical protein KFK09_026863 [Dendrobium nobile]|uniref:Glutaredoxin-dependent peroxiredoxin n=1 Tax=Dendrobium nobile TaxID=94219 RepID=A0A8T3A910_DENNO|nr:hypothetical protein KFK09_026863 [Dendrobium nobile]
MAPITVGDTVPDGTLHWFDENDELQKLSIHSVAAGKKILIIGVPGAFNPIFSVQHLPGFIPSAEKLKFKGVDEIVLIGVNDSFVMKAWAKRYPDHSRVKFLADESSRILGLELDLSEKAPAVHSHGYAFLLEDLKVKVANVKQGGDFTISDAEEILESL